MAPKDEAEMRDMMLTAIEHPGPAALRYPRGNGFGVDISEAPNKIEVGKAEILKDGGEVAIIAYGSMVYPAMEAAKNLEKDGIEATVINARFVKPLDSELIIALAQSMRLIVTVEDAYLAGGFGSAILELLEENSLSDKIKVVRMGVPDRIVTHGDPKLLLAKYFHAEVQKLGFESKIEPELSVVTYRWLPENGDTNIFNKRLLDEVVADGRVFISSTMLNGEFTLRFACLAFRTHLKTVDTLLTVLKDKVEIIEKN